MATPDKGILYQPLNVDSHWRAVDWEPRLEALKRQQIDTLYLQWTRHQGSTFGGNGGWLWQLMHQASEQGFDLVLGLYAEPVYFEHINESFAPDYWTGYLADNAEWGRVINSYLDNIPELNVTAFFFPGELNDLVLAERDALARVSADLATLQRSLGRPLYVSTFYTGHLTASEYKEALHRLRSEHVHVIHQDGAGTRALNKNQVDEVLDELNCEFGVIEELFVQRSADDFDVLSEHLIWDKVSKSGCAQRVFFSWRYIAPW